ncbi:MAG: hypothetical protein V1744_04145 [Candidatus Altiarchaeota archaeon]
MKRLLSNLFRKGSQETTVNPPDQSTIEPPMELPTKTADVRMKSNDGPGVDQSAGVRILIVANNDRFDELSEVLRSGNRTIKKARDIGELPYDLDSNTIIILDKFSIGEEGVRRYSNKFESRQNSILYTLSTTTDKENFGEAFSFYIGTHDGLRKTVEDMEKGMLHY